MWVTNDSSAEAPASWLPCLAGVNDEEGRTKLSAGLPNGDGWNTPLGRWMAEGPLGSTFPSTFLGVTTEGFFFAPRDFFVQSSFVTHSGGGVGGGS